MGRPNINNYGKTCDDTVGLCYRTIIMLVLMVKEIWQCKLLHSVRMGHISLWHVSRFFFPYGDQVRFSTGADKTLRVWNNAKRAEIARLQHISPIVNVTWLEGDIGVVTLGEDGIVGKWTRVVSAIDFTAYFVKSTLSLQGGNYWQWAKIVDACEKGTQDATGLAYYRDRIGVPIPDKTCLAYYRDRIAVSFPKTGVKMWIWLKGDGTNCIS